MARVPEAVVLGGPHLVLPHAGDNDRFALREVRDLLDDVLGLDQLVVPVVAEWVLLLPLAELPEPLLPSLPDRRGRLAGAFLATSLMRQLTKATIYAAFTWKSLFAAAVVAVVIGLVFGTYPALRAARLSPVDAMRNE